MTTINVGLYKNGNYPSAVTEYAYSTENLSTGALEDAASTFVMTHIGSEIHLYMDKLTESAMMILMRCVVWNIPVVFYLRNKETGEYQSQKMF